MAAALVSVIIGAWVYDLYFRGDAKDCHGIACVDRYDIVRSKTIELFENEDLYEMVDPRKLEQNLDKRKNDRQPDSVTITPEDLLDDI
jgi:hypothetical protein